MILSPHLSQLPAQPSLSELLEFQATGLVVVVGALALLWFLLELTGAFFRRRTALPASVPVESAVPDDSINQGVVAAIAAAVHVTLQGRPHQITEIRATDANPTWAAEGRRDHFSSHRVR